MPTKTAQLQIRVSVEQKRRLKQLAREASMDLSSWVLSRALPDEPERFQTLTAALRAEAERSFRLAEVADFLRGLPAAAFQRAVAQPPRARLDAGTLNHLAGAIDLAAQRRGQEPPVWTRTVAVPAIPVFGSSLASLRGYLLTRAPVALRRRNLFVDASVDERV